MLITKKTNMSSFSPLLSTRAESLKCVQKLDIPEREAPEDARPQCAIVLQVEGSFPTGLTLFSVTSLAISLQVSFA